MTERNEGMMIPEQTGSKDTQEEVIVPLADWENGESESLNLVWMSRLDGKYQVEAQRTGDYSANLIIFDHTAENSIILNEPVDLAYGARFGPDVDDVAEWQERAIRIVDNLGEKDG